MNHICPNRLNFGGLMYRLKLASDIGVQSFVVELVVKVIVDLVKSNIIANRPYSPPRNDCSHC